MFLLLSLIPTLLEESQNSVIYSAAVGTDRRVCPCNRIAVSCWAKSKHLNINPCALPQFLTLLLLLFIYFVVFLSQLFDRKKLQKLPALGLSKSLKALARELPCNITHPPFSRRLCLPFQSREQKNSLHVLPASYGTYAQTLLFLFLYWNWHALLLKRCRISFWYYLLFAVFHKHR